MRIIARVTDPDQEHIDAAVADLHHSVRDGYDELSTTEGIRATYADLDRRALESRLAFESRRAVEGRVLREAWRKQNHHDKQHVADQAAQNLLGALAVVRRINELARDGRKTAKIAELAEVYKQHQEEQA